MSFLPKPLRANRRDSPFLSCNSRKSRPYAERRITAPVCRGEALTLLKSTLRKPPQLLSGEASSQARLHRESEDVKKSLRLLSEERLTPREVKPCGFVDHLKMVGVTSPRHLHLSAFNDGRFKRRSRVVSKAPTLLAEREASRAAKRTSSQAERLHKQGGTVKSEDVKKSLRLLSEERLTPREDVKLSLTAQ